MTRGGLVMHKLNSPIWLFLESIMLPRCFPVLCLVVSAAVLAGCGSKAGMTVISPPPPAPPAASVTISVTPSAVLPGQSATLTWTSANATACTGSGSWTGVLKSSGSMNVMLQTPAAQTYSLQCSGDGAPATKTVTLELASSSLACAAHPAAVVHGSRRSVRRPKLAGSHS